MGKIITANFSTGEKNVRATGLDQYDYGAVLRIQGLNLPPAVEIHFCLQETGGEAPRRVGITKDGVTDVIIPDSMLENGNTTHDYNIYAWVYLTDDTSGSTERRITMKVRSRSKPEAFDRPEDAELFREAIAAVNEASERAEDAEKSSEAWAHGHEDYPERGEDNARYYAEQAKMHAEHVSEDAKKEIDEYVKWKEQELKGEPGTPGEDGIPGKDGITPHIGENNHWWIGDVDTGVDARGKKGNDGDTPRIGENGHWYIGENDTGVNSQGTDGLPGTDGVDGVTPHIGENKNWWVGETDTGITAEGKDGAPGHDGEPGKPGKSAYQYAQDSGYTGTEEEFTQKLATEYPTDVQINGTSIVGEDGVAIIPKGNENNFGVYRLLPNSSGRMFINSQNYLGVSVASNGDISDRIKGRYNYRLLSIDNSDYMVKLTMTDGKGAAWTDTEKTGAWSRLSSIKTAMDEVAVAGARYYLPEQTELSITLPDDALTGQEITVVWYNGETPATLAISGNMLDLDYAPGANSRSEISCLWDGTYWSLIGNEQSVPTTTEEVVESE